MTTEQMLEKEIQTGFENLKTIPIGTDEYVKAVDGVSKLMDRRSDCIKIEKDKKSELWKNAILIGTTVLGTGITIWGTVVTLNFEKTGTLTTLAGRAFTGKLLKK